MERRSPLNHVDRIVTPLMVIQGANDPRVRKQESDQIVAALRERGVDVEYICKDGEGHGFVKPENRMEAYGAMERFFAKHLGGVSPPTEVRDPRRWQVLACAMGAQTGSAALTLGLPALGPQFRSELRCRWSGSGRCWRRPPSYMFTMSWGAVGPGRTAGDGDRPRGSATSWRWPRAASPRTLGPALLAGSSAPPRRRRAVAPSSRGFRPISGGSRWGCGTPRP